MKASTVIPSLAAPTNAAVATEAKGNFLSEYNAAAFPNITTMQQIFHSCCSVRVGKSKFHALR
jgi:hypothetical protein